MFIREQIEYTQFMLQKAMSCADSWQSSFLKHILLYRPAERSKSTIYVNKILQNEGTLNI